MSLHYDLFGELSEPPEPERQSRRYRTMQELHGIKEGNDTCKTCKHCLCERYHGRTYYKCELYYISNSAATDIRLKNKACKKYEREGEG